MFVSAFTSATLLPGTSEAALAAVLASGKAALVPAIGVATAGNSAGSCVNWAMGRYLAHFQGAWWFPVKPEKFDTYQRWYQKWGVWSLALSWAPVIGDPLTALAGVARMPMTIFLPVVVVAKLARYLVVAGVFSLAG